MLRSQKMCGLPSVLRVNIDKTDGVTLDSPAKIFKDR